MDDVSAWRARVGQHDGFINSGLLHDVVIGDFTVWFLVLNRVVLGPPK